VIFSSFPLIPLSLLVFLEIRVPGFGRQYPRQLIVFPRLGDAQKQRYSPPPTCVDVRQAPVFPQRTTASLRVLSNLSRCVLKKKVPRDALSSHMTATWASLSYIFSYLSFHPLFFFDSEIPPLRSFFLPGPRSGDSHGAQRVSRWSRFFP